MVATRCSIRLAPRLGLVAEPNPVIPQHTTPVPEAGGLGVLAGLLAACACWVALREIGADLAPIGASSALLVGIAGFFAIGLVDDRVDFSEAGKFGLQAG